MTNIRYGPKVSPQKNIYFHSLCLCVCLSICVTSQMYIGIYAIQIIKGPIKPYLFNSSWLSLHTRLEQPATDHISKRPVAQFTSMSSPTTLSTPTTLTTLTISTDKCRIRIVYFDLFGKCPHRQTHT